MRAGCCGFGNPRSDTFRKTDVFRYTEGARPPQLIPRSGMATLLVRYRTRRAGLALRMQQVMQALASMARSLRQVQQVR